MVDRESIRSNRRAPSVGGFNPDTYFDAQLQIDERGREETDQKSWWDFAIGPVEKATNALKSFFGFPLSRVQNSESEISQLTLSFDEDAKEAARARKADYKSTLHAWTSFQKKKYEFDQFSFETGALQEVYENALNPMYQDMETIKTHLRKICASQNVSLGCPI